MTLPREVCYNDPDVWVEGQVYTDFCFGRPYSDQPGTNEMERAVIIALDKAITVRRGTSVNDWQFEEEKEHVDRIQLATCHAHTLGMLKGYGVRVKGELFPAHTGHHHTEVLMSVEEPPLPIDARNTCHSNSPSSSGTGFLLGRGGLIATAAHVVADMIDVTITTGLYRQRVEIVSIDDVYDLAILKASPTGVLADVIQERELTVRPARTWMSPRLGERVYAFGFSFGGSLPHSLNVTEGLVSSQVGFEAHQFQISAAIQDGNSGGPVFDAFGNLIGVSVSSIAGGQLLNFCVQGQHFVEFCVKNGIRIDCEELSSNRVYPDILAEQALHFCVEVEGWADKWQV